MNTFDRRVLIPAQLLQWAVEVNVGGVENFSIRQFGLEFYGAKEMDERRLLGKGSRLIRW